MSKEYKVLDVQRTKGKNFNKINLMLIDENGDKLEYPVEFTTKMIKDEMRGQCISVDRLSEEFFLQAIGLLVISAIIVRKYEGEPFVANEFTNPVTIDNGQT